MYKAKTLLGIIPARGGSKRLPHKNILSCAGKPLIAWTIEAAQASRTIDRVVVNTEDNEIKEVSEQYNAEIVRRPEVFATDTATSFDVIIQTLDALSAQGYRPDIAVMLQATSPLRTAADIDSAVQLLPDGEEEAMVVSVCGLQNPAAAWSFIATDDHLEPILGWDVLIKRSQDVPTLYIPNGAVFVFSPEVIRKRGRIYGPPLIPYFMPVERSIDIDTQEEFEEAEARMMRSA